MRRSTRQPYRKTDTSDEMSEAIRSGAAPGSGGGMYTRESARNTGSPKAGQRWPPEAREGQAGRPWGGGEFVEYRGSRYAVWREGTQFRTDAYWVKDLEIGNLSTPINVQKLKMALHAKREVLSKPDAGNLPVRFDERDVETEPWWNH